MSGILPIIGGGGGGGASLSNATPQPLGTPAPGTSTDASRADHVHQMPDLGDLDNVSVSAPNNGDVLSFDLGTSTWVATAVGAGVTLSTSTPQALGVASAGTGAQASRDDHVHAMPDLGDLGDVSASTPSDGDVLAFDTGSSTWTTTAPLGLSSATPAALGVAAAGTGTAASRDDHVHAVPALGDLSNVSVAAPSDGEVLTYDNATSTWIAAAAGGGGGGWPTSTGTDTNGRAYEQALVATANTSLIITPTGTGAIQAQIADNTTAGGNARGNNAVDLQTSRTNAAQVANGANSVIAGGLRNTASGARSFVGGGEDNTTSGTESVVCGGDGNTASSTNATVGGGLNNTASGSDATVGGGSINTASGNSATVAGGAYNTTSGSYATVPGGYYGIANQYGMLSHASGRFSSTGDAQYSRMILRRQTTDATPAVLTADGSAPGAATRVALPAESAYCFDVYVIATQSAGVAGTASDSAWWHFRGGIKRDNSNNTSLIGTNVSETGADAGAAAWVVTVTADDTNEALQIEVTGEVLKTIRWVATVQYSRVAY